MDKVDHEWTQPGCNELEAGRFKEDRALKYAVQFFGAVLLPRLGITMKIRRIAPTEQIHLEMKEFIEDFNFEMEDGTWRHFEFESDSITEKDLMRFRSYEAVASYYYGVEVTTCVICTANVKSPRTELKQGINRYRVKVIRLKGRNADKLIRALERKQRTQSLDRGDLAELLLTPLMSGEMEIPERIEKSIQLIQKERETLGKEDLLRMQSVLYTFAMKFLSTAELEKMQEVFEMTVLGQMLEDRGVERGIEKGIARGIEKGIEVLVQTCRELGVSRDDMQKKLMAKFTLTDDAAEGYLLKYWKK